MCDSIIESLENKNSTCAIFLDLAKAFDTVYHQILLSKLMLIVFVEYHLN